MKTGDLVLVAWVDSHSDGSWQSLRDTIGEARRDGMECQTLGIVLDETDDYLLVAASKTEARDACVAGTMQIPQVAIRSIHRLQVGRAVAR